MKKDDFIYNVEKWLVRNDVSDEEYMRSPSQIKKTNVASYVESVEQTLKWKASDLLDDFYKKINYDELEKQKETYNQELKKIEITEDNVRYEILKKFNAFLEKEIRTNSSSSKNSKINIQ